MDQNVLATEIVEPFSRSLSFLGHGGEMGRAMREKDWLGSPLDEPGQWPQELKSTIALMLNSGHSMFLAWGPELTFFYNDAYIPLLGSKHPALGKPFQDVWHDIWPDIEPIVLDALAGKSTWLEDFRLLTERNGYPEEAFFTFSYSPVRNSQGEVCGLFSAVNETTGKVDAMNRRRAVEEELVQSQEQLRQSNEYLNTIISQASVGIAQTDIEGRFMLVNDRYCEILGRSRADLLGRKVKDLTHPEDQLLHAEAFDRVVRSGEALFIEKRGLRPDGSHVWVNNHLSLSRDADGNPQHVIKVSIDITERKENELHIKYLATHDPLTKLPNRTLLKERMLHSIQAAQYLGTKVALLFLDLNRFKMVNDSLGHDQGDQLLKVIAERLRSCTREGDTTARIGGDEFVIVLDALEFVSDAIGIAEEVLASVAEPVRLAGHDVSVSTSIGISVYPRDGSDPTILLKSADTAMYQAKEMGGGTFRFYSPDMNARLLERLLTESRLREAIGRGELVLYYQPRVSLVKERIVAIEALVRWDHPENGLMLPDDFIPIAEEIGLIEEIGRTVLMQACEQNKRWQQQGQDPVRVSVNISPRQLTQGDLPYLVRSVLEATGLAPQWLELEVTESGLMHNITAAQETLQQIRDLGVGISIDDFGTGYSSLNHLKRLPIDTLKIDKTFVRDLPFDSDDVSIVTATIALAKSMNLRVVAEGVRSVEQLYFLKDRECEEVQGYLFGLPVPAEQMEGVLMHPDSIIPLARK
ncbi:EAL domain-containing protein [Hydrocarboniclastica marina]|nr:bifunctional diguanylate cyclase/phosphodiesterase [Hydrocarboniclastica marina]